jgi:hypothetical protein
MTVSPTEAIFRPCRKGSTRDHEEAWHRFESLPLPTVATKPVSSDSAPSRLLRMVEPCGDAGDDRRAAAGALSRAREGLR